MPLNLSTKPTSMDESQTDIDIGRRVGVTGGMIWSPASMCEKDIVNKNSLKRQHMISDECSENSEEDYSEDTRSQLIKRFKLDQVRGSSGLKSGGGQRGRISSESAIVSPGINNYPDSNNRNCGSENSRDSALYKFKSEIINRINRNSRSADEDEDEEDKDKESVRRAFAAAAACVVSAAAHNGIVPKFHGFDRANFKKMLMENFNELDKSCDIKSEDNNCSSDSSLSPGHNSSHIAQSPKDYLYFPSTRFHHLKQQLETDSELAGPDSTANHHSPSSFDFHHRFAYNENSGNEQNLQNHHHQHHSNVVGEEKKRERNFQVGTTLLLADWCLNERPRVKVIGMM